MTKQLTNCITFNVPPTKEVMRLDKEGFHYRGQVIADAGEAHRLMVEFLKQQTQPALRPGPMTNLSPAAHAVLDAYTDAPISGRVALAAALRSAVAHTQQHRGLGVWECDANELLDIADELEGQ
jgi:hypothetical protein